MSSGTVLNLPAVSISSASSLSSLSASTTQALANLNVQFQQISSAFTLIKPKTTADGTVGGIRVGNIDMGSTNYIKGGATGYNAGTGFFLGYDFTGTPGYKFFVGKSTGNKITWDGSGLYMLGGSAPNNVIIDSTGFTVGAAGAKRVAVGTYAGNPASLNFYNAANVSLMGLYLAGGNYPSLDMTNNIGGSVSMYVDTAGTNGHFYHGMVGNAGVGANQYYTTNAFGVTALLVYGPDFGGFYTNITVQSLTSATATSILGDTIQASNGSLARPAYSFSSDTDTGWRWNSSGDMRGVCNGADVFVVRSAAIVCIQPLKLANAFVGGAPAATGYVTVQDSSGTTYKLLCAP